MKLKAFKKIISGTVSAMMIASSIPAVTFAADQQTRGNIGGYDYEMWNQNGQGQVSMQPGAGSFTCSWSNIENFLARMGKNYDSQGKNYKQIGNIVLTYDVEYTPRGNSYMCVYGWTKSPLVEYYIVEGWGDWRPPGNDAERKGTVTLNGNTYDIAKTMRYNQPSLEGNSTFPQYWSIRQTSGSRNNTTNYMKGTIDVSKHFDAWSQAGLDMSGKLYEVSLNIEGYRSNGSANVKSVNVTTGGSGGGSDNNQQQNNQPQNNGWGNPWENQQQNNQQQNNGWGNPWENQQQNNQQQNNTAPSASQGSGLKDLFAPWFKIGTSVSPHELNSGASFIKENYNSITPENELKPDSILDQSACQQRGNNVNTQINLSRAAQTLKFCESNGISLRGHTFVWYSQTPDWFFRENFSNNGAYVSKDIMNKRLESMIKNTFDALKTQYPKLDVYAYDVCNELFKNDGGGMRPAGNAGSGGSTWVQIYGDDSFVMNAFKYARQYAPAGCKLYLNDYNEYIGAKTDDIYNMAMKLKQQGTIDGIGMQAHLATNYPDAKTFETALKKFLSTGLDVQITELDITCSDLNAQANLYEDIFKIAMANSSKIPALTIWGTSDNVSWRSSQNPLLFSQGYKPKPAYDKVVALAKSGSVAPSNNSSNNNQQQNNNNNQQNNQQPQQNQWNWDQNQNQNNQWNWNQQPQQNNQQPQNNNNNSAGFSANGQKFSVGNGQNQHKGDNVDGYSYEIWLDNTGGSGSMTLGSGGSFSTEWSATVNAGNFLARRGRNYDASKKATQYGPIVMDYAADYSASSQGNSRLCVYGWMKDPLVEYYIIEDWVNWCPSANGQSKTVTIDGAQYEIFQLDHTGPTILGNTQTFKQYFSVRKSKRTSGTITVSDHFKAWEAAGWNIGNLTEVALNVEGWESSGKANVSKLTIGTSGSGNNNNNNNNQQPQNNNNNNQWNQQQNNQQQNQWNWNQNQNQNQNQNNQWNQQQNNGWNNDWFNNVTKWGDANGDNSVDMGDTVSIMQSLANPNKYNLTDQGMYNGDVYNPGTGITNNDAQSLQMFFLGSIPNLPFGNDWNNGQWNGQNNNQWNWNQNQNQNNQWNQQQNNQQPQQNQWNWNQNQNNQWNWNQQPQQNNQQPQNNNNNSAGFSANGQKFSVGNGQNQHKGDNVDGYSYEIWLDNTGGSGSMTLGSGGSFSTEWSATVNAGNFLARRGRNYDASKKATQYGPIVMDYAADYSASSQGNSRLCVYGWMKDPLVEYYIIEDWVNWCPSANGQSKTVTIDGAQYEIFQLDHTGPTILGNTQTFKQYFSVRKSKRTSGTITVSDHFKAWEAAGWNIGNLTEVALNVEGWESSGKANVSKLTIGTSGSGNNNNNQQPQNNNNNNNNQWNQQQNNGWGNQWNQPQQNTQPNNGGVQSGKKLCAISFDDGASATSKSDPGYRIIDALIKNNMTATFFNVGDWIKSNDQIKYEYQNGMEVANHTKSHPHLGQLGGSQIRSEWEQCNSKLKSIIGTEPSHLMRLPYLESNATVQSALNDVPLISCAIDTQDWNGASKDQIVNTIKQAAQNGSLEGAIVLCHETYANTAAAMEEVLPWLAQNGYQNVSISDMAKAHGKNLAGGQVHTRA